jgi:hypothetical protein
MDWKDILIAQAITTVIAIASSGSGKGKFRPALLKVLRTIAQQVATEAELRALIQPTEAKR